MHDTDIYLPQRGHTSRTILHNSIRSSYRSRRIRLHPHINQITIREVHLTNRFQGKRRSRFNRIFYRIMFLHIIPDKFSGTIIVTQATTTTCRYHRIKLHIVIRICVSEMSTATTTKISKMNSIIIHQHKTTCSCPHALRLFNSGYFKKGIIPSFQLFHTGPLVDTQIFIGTNHIGRLQVLPRPISFCIIHVICILVIFVSTSYRFTGQTFTINCFKNIHVQFPVTIDKINIRISILIFENIITFTEETGYH